MSNRVPMKKIIVTKNDEATVIAEKIIDTDAVEITLSIPRFSKLAESAANFRLLKREAQALGKTITIETVGEAVQKLAEVNHIPCVDPFFAGERRHVSDIVVGREKKYTRKEKEQEREDERFEEPVISREPMKKNYQGKTRKSRTRLLVVGVIAIAGFTGIIFFLSLLPKAEIKITTKKTAWSYNDAVIVDKNVASFDAKAGAIPGQIFSESKNLQVTFPATGTKKSSTKSSGIVTLYNAYSVSSQGLVSGTRLQTPDGKIFRITSSVVIPGAKVVSGKITPSSIDTQVEADKAGDEYNIDPVQKFTIPGFAGSPKFNGFYGSSKAPMTGGFIGDAAYAPDTQVKQAEAVAAHTLEDSMKALILTELPPDFKVIDGSIQFKITGQKVGTKADANGQVPLSVEGDISVTAFKERDLVNMLLEKATDDTNVSFDIQNYKIDYGAPRFSQNGKMSFSVTFNGTLTKPIDTAALKEKIRGKSENELKALIFSLPGLDTAKISLWPFWVRSVPDKIEKITISVD